MTEPDYVIELPFLPDSALSPNFKGHWSERYRAGTTINYAVHLMVKKIAIPGLDSGTVRVVFTVPDQRRRDQDNWLARAKPAIDGLVAAGVFKDDDSKHLMILPVVFEYRKGASKIRLEIWKKLIPQEEI